MVESLLCSRHSLRPTAESHGPEPLKMLHFLQQVEPHL
jgi:hypothetical protein